LNTVAPGPNRLVAILPSTSVCTLARYPANCNDCVWCRARANCTSSAVSLSL
jgi:hypothetical protein